MLRAGPTVFPVTCGASPTLRKPSPCRRPIEIVVHLLGSTSCSERMITGRIPTEIRNLYDLINEAKQMRDIELTCASIETEFIVFILDNNGCKISTCMIRFSNV